MKAWTRLQDWTTVVLGVILFLMPWILGTTARTSSAWDAWIIGIIAVTLALLSLGLPRSTLIMASLTILAGLWLIISPWVLAFASLTSVTWMAVIIGLLLIVASGWTVRETRMHHVGVTA